MESGENRSGQGGKNDKGQPSRKSDKKKILLWAFVIVYILSPIDLLPEALIGPVGFLDDIGLIGYAFAKTVGIHPYLLFKNRFLKRNK